MKILVGAFLILEVTCSNNSSSSQCLGTRGKKSPHFRNIDILRDLPLDSEMILRFSYYHICYVVNFGAMQRKDE